MNPLTELMRKQIAQSGPITIAEYMALCLAHPEHGYYRTRDPLGVEGDFTTAPEISQMFGEMIGLWLAQVWMDQGSPDRFVLAELGPGRGTLMADALRAASKAPGFLEAVRLHLVETSPALRAKQTEMLGAYEPRWLDTVEELPDGPVFVVANEFFDALPIRQFQRDASQWRERMVSVSGDMLVQGLSPAFQSADLDKRFGWAPTNAVVETCPAAEAIAKVVGDKISGAGSGAALFIDYGDWQGSGDTLQALRAHNRVNPFENQGEADLTAHVGFGALAGSTALRAQFTTQGEFLEILGVTLRARALAERKNADSVAAQHRRLTHPDEMGSLFKVMGLASFLMPQLPGFGT